MFGFYVSKYENQFSLLRVKNNFKEETFCFLAVKAKLKSIFQLSHNKKNHTTHKLEAILLMVFTKRGRAKNHIWLQRTFKKGYNVTDTNIKNLKHML